MRLRLVLFLCLCVAALATAAPAAAPAPTAAPAPGFQLGLVDNIFLYDTTDALARALDLGVRIVRVDFAWDPSSASWQDAPWAAQLRNLVTALPPSQFRVVVAFTVPRAQDAPQDDGARLRFCSSAAQLVRDLPQIHDVVIANEPNSNRFWLPQFDADGNPVSPESYFKLAALCYDMLHAVRPDIDVIGPATAGRGNDNPDASSNASLSPTTFIADLGAAYRASGRDRPIFDTIDHHPYPLTANERPWLRHQDPRIIGEGDLGRLVSAYHAAFDGTAQPTPGHCVNGKCVDIWYTEDGFQTVPSSSSQGAYTGVETDPTALPAGGADEGPDLPDAASPAPSQQVQLRDAIEYAYCQPYVTAFLNFHLQDEPALEGWQSGLLYADGTEKPSYATFRDLVGETSTGKVDCNRYLDPLREIAAPTRSDGTFVDTELGPAGQAPLVHRPAPDTSVRITGAGDEVQRGDDRVAIALEDAGSASWQTHRNGASRSTRFGSESVTVTPSKSEQYLTVTTPQGRRLWRWTLDAGGDTPRLRADGSIEFVTPTGVTAPLAVAPARIYDQHGQDVTPPGLRWGLTQSGSQWTLELDLDDSSLPLPYVIDPAILLVDATSNGANTSSFTLSRPASVAPNDVMLAEVAWKDGTGVTVTPPAGWTLVRRDDHTTDFSQAIYVKVAGSSEPASYTFALSAAAEATGGIADFSGVDTANPVDVSAALSGSGATPISAPTVTTTGPNEAVVVFYGDRADTTFTSVPSGTTELWNEASSQTTSQAATFDQEAPGSTGEKTTTTGTSDSWIADTVALRRAATGPGAVLFRAASQTSRAAATSIALDRPTGVQAHDLMLALVDVQGGTGTGITPPAGWTLVRTDDSTTKLEQAIYYRVATDSDPASWTWSFSQSEPASGGIVAYRGVDTSDPIGATSAGSGAASTAVTAPGITTSAADSVVVGFFGGDSSTSFAPDPSLVERIDPIGSGGSGSTGSEAADMQQRTAGATGDKTATASAAVDWVAQLVELKVDTTAPTQSISVVEGTRPDLQYFDSGTSTLYYNPAATGTFTVSDSPSDSGSGIAYESFPGTTTYADEVLADHPVSYWRLGESSGTTAADEEGTNPGTYTGGYTLGQTGALGDGDTAAAFDGTSGYVDLGNPPSLQLDSGTVEAWFKTSGGSGYRAIVSKDYAYYVGVEDGVLVLWDWNAFTARTTGINVSDNAWHHVAVTFQNGVPNGTKVYLDGALVLTTTVASTGQTGSARIGSSAGWGEYFDGAIDDVAIYDTLLSQQRILDHYDARANAGIPGFSVTAAWRTAAPWQSHTYTFDPSSTTAPAAQTITLEDNAQNVTSSTITFVRDVTAPTVSAALSGGPYYDTLSVPLTLSATDADSGVDPATSTVERDEATLAGGTCGSFSGSWTPVALTGGADTTVVSGTCYRYRYRVSDRVGNQSTWAVTADAEVDTTAPAAPSLTLSASAAGSYVSGTTFYYRPAAAGGTFTVTATSSDADAGLEKIRFPGLAGGFAPTSATDHSTSPYVQTYTWPASTGSESGAQTVTAYDRAGNTTGKTFTIVADSTAPTGESASPSGGPWYATASVPLVVDTGTDAQSGVDPATLVVERDQATLSNGTCGAYSGSWTPVTLTGGADTTVEGGNCYRYRVEVSDNVGNTAISAASADAKVDTSRPSAYAAAVLADGPAGYWRLDETAGTAAADEVGASPGTYVGGVTLGATGALNEDDTAVELDGSSAEVTLGDVTTPRTIEAWIKTTASGDQAIFSNRGAYADSTVYLGLADGKVRGFRETGTPRGVQSATAVNDGAWHYVAYTWDGTTARIYVDGVEDVAVAQSDVQTPGTHPAAIGWDASSGDWFSGTIDEVAVYPTTLSAERIHTHYERGLDDGLTLSESKADEYVSGTTLYYNPGAGTSGTFTVTAAASDPESGAASVAFPAVFGADGATATTAPFARTYSWSAGASASGPQTVTVANPAGLTSSGTFTLAPDTTAPSGQTVALAAPPSGDWYTAASVALTLENGSDGGSGIDAGAGVVERARAPLRQGSCGSFGSWTAVTLVGGADTSVASGHCYRYRYTVSDNVGNRSAPSAATADAKVDTSAPTTTAAFGATTGSTYSDGGGTLYYRPGGAGTFTVTAAVTDAQSGPAGAAFPAVAGFGAGGDVAAPGPYSASYGYSGTPAEPGSISVVGENAVGGRSAAALTITADADAPTGVSATVAGGYVTTPSVAVTLADGTDAGSGVDSASGVVERESAALEESACAAFTGDWSAVPLVGGADTSVASGMCYRYRYRIADRVGNVAVSAPSAIVMVDTAPAPPAPAIVSAPRSPGNDPTPHWSFRAEPARSAQSVGADAATECRLTRGTAVVSDWRDCVSPVGFDLTSEPNGRYEFAVRALATDGRPGPAARASYELDREAPPAPRLGPVEGSGGRTPTWPFVASESVRTECRVVRGSDVVRDWSPCSSPFTLDLRGEPAGTYVVSIRGYDEAGNASDAARATFVLAAAASPPAEDTTPKAAPPPPPAKDATPKPAPLAAAAGGGEPPSASAPAAKAPRAARTPVPQRAAPPEQPAAPTPAKRTAPPRTRPTATRHHSAPAATSPREHTGPPRPERTTAPARPARPRSGAAAVAAKVFKQVARAAIEGSKRSSFPFALLLLVAAFLVVQDRIDRKDPKLAAAPVAAEPALEFGPPDAAALVLEAVAPPPAAKDATPKAAPPAAASAPATASEVAAAVERAAAVQPQAPGRASGIPTTQDTRAAGMPVGEREAPAHPGAAAPAKRAAVFPFALLGLVAAFLVVRNRIDPRRPEARGRARRRAGM